MLCLPNLCYSLVYTFCKRSTATVNTYLYGNDQQTYSIRSENAPKSTVHLDRGHTFNGFAHVTKEREFRIILQLEDVWESSRLRMMRLLEDSNHNALSSRVSCCMTEERQSSSRKLNFALKQIDIVFKMYPFLFSQTFVRDDPLQVLELPYKSIENKILLEANQLIYVEHAISFSRKTSVDCLQGT